jgi:hypothetical protein
MVATIGEALQSAGHSVLLYAPFISKALFLQTPFSKFRCTDNSTDLIEFNPDVCYTQHHTTAVIVRHILPYCPILHGVLGVLPFLEQPPLMDLSFFKTLVLSEEVHNHVLRTVGSADKLVIFRNVIDEKPFIVGSQPAAEPKCVVLHSYKLNEEMVDRIGQACEKAGLTLIDRRPQIAGRMKYEDVPSLIREGHIVISSGRSAIESMCAGRAVVVMADCGEDGLITSDNFGVLLKNNFSGRAFGRRFSVDELADEFNKYSEQDVTKLSIRARNEFGLSARRDEIQCIFIAASKTRPDSKVCPQREFLSKTLTTLLSFRHANQSIDLENSLHGDGELIKNGQRAWLEGNTKQALACFWEAFNADRTDAQALNALVSLLLCFLSAANDEKPPERKKALEALLALNPSNRWAAEQLVGINV